MKKLSIVALLVSISTLATITAHAQLIDYKRKAKSAAQVSISELSFDGTITNINSRANQITVRNYESKQTKEFVVTSEQIDSLSRYDDVRVTYQEGSDVAQSVTALN